MFYPYTDTCLVVTETYREGVEFVRSARRYTPELLLGYRVRLVHSSGWRATRGIHPARAIVVLRGEPVATGYEAWRMVEDSLALVKMNRLRVGIGSLLVVSEVRNKKRPVLAVSRWNDGLSPTPDILPWG